MVAPSAQLVDALRRRAKRRQSRKGLRPAQFPRTAELAYIKELRDLSRDMSDIIRRKVLPLLESKRQDADTRAPVPVEVTRVIESLRVQVGERVVSRAPAVAGRMVQETSTESRKALNASYEKVVGLNPWKNDDALRGLQAGYIRDNVALIQSIPNRQLAEVQDVIAQGLASGTRVETLKQQIEERFEVSESRAKLIARDQVGKLNADLNEERQKQIGVTSYKWVSSNDERVRPMHAALDGTSHTWDDPPVTNERGDRNHPGQDIQCRCSSVADIDGLLDSLGI